MCKICANCLQTLHISDFYAYNGKPRAQCKNCFRALYYRPRPRPRPVKLTAPQMEFAARKWETGAIDFTAIVRLCRKLDDLGD